MVNLQYAIDEVERLIYSANAYGDDRLAERLEYVLDLLNDFKDSIKSNS